MKAMVILHVNVLEGQTVLDLMTCYEQSDIKQLVEIQKRSTLKYLDNEVLKIVLKLPPPRGAGAKHDATSHLQDKIEEEGFC